MTEKLAKIVKYESRKKRYYKVPFEKVPYLAKTMRAFMKNGFVYLEDEHIPLILAQKFRKILEKRLAISLKHLPQVFQDKRIRNILLHISKVYVGDDFSKQSTVTGGIVNLGNLNAYATP